jgi:hypothetical protein
MMLLQHTSPEAKNRSKIPILSNSNLYQKQGLKFSGLKSPASSSGNVLRESLNGSLNESIQVEKTANKEELARKNSLIP